MRFGVGKGGQESGENALLLYLIQHGIAKTEEEDPDRDLTDQGAAEVERIAAYLKAKDTQIHVVWHSGKTRARHTAEILADALDVANRLLEHSGLAPKDDVLPIAEKLEGSQNNVMLVGHLPFLSRLASTLLTGSPDKEILRFRYSCLACLEREAKGWRLCWMVTPESLP
jgi:phosphohistidine phosphatase